MKDGTEGSRVWIDDMEERALRAGASPQDIATIWEIAHRRAITMAMGKRDNPVRRTTMRRKQNLSMEEFKAKATSMARRSAEATKRGAVAVGRGAKSLAKKAAPHVKRGAVAVGKAAKKGAKYTAKQTGRGMRWTGERMAAWGTKANSKTLTGYSGHNSYVVRYVEGEFSFFARDDREAMRTGTEMWAKKCAVRKPYPGRVAVWTTDGRYVGDLSGCQRRRNPRSPLKHPKQVRWTEGEYWPSSHYNPSPTVIYKGKELPCGCGSRDDISVWEWPDRAAFHLAIRQAEMLHNRDHGLDIHSMEFREKVVQSSVKYLSGAKSKQVQALLADQRMGAVVLDAMVKGIEEWVSHQTTTYAGVNRSGLAGPKKEWQKAMKVKSKKNPTAKQKAKEGLAALLQRLGFSVRLNKNLPYVGGPGWEITMRGTGYYFPFDGGVWVRKESGATTQVEGNWNFKAPYTETGQQAAVRWVLQTEGIPVAGQNGDRSRTVNPRAPLKHPKQVRWTKGEYWPSSHYNPSPTVIYKGKELPCGCGSRDDISVWEWAEYIHVLCVNTGLGYVGLKVFDLARAADVGTLPTDHPAKDDEVGLIGEMFMDRDYDIDETFGKRGLSGTSGKKMVEILNQWIH